jgi:hypothetical protein
VERLLDIAELLAATKRRQHTILWPRWAYAANNYFFSGLYWLILDILGLDAESQEGLETLAFSGLGR